MSRCESCGQKECCGADMAEEIATLRAQLAAAEAKYSAYREYVQGCVDAAFIEGLAEALAEHSGDVGGLRDLVERRLLHVQYFYEQAALAKEEG